jgi:hypothetical protein
MANAPELICVSLVYKHNLTYTERTRNEIEFSLLLPSGWPVMKINKFLAVQDRPFQCESCPAAFSRKPYLDIHTRIHTG